MYSFRFKFLNYLLTSWKASLRWASCWLAPLFGAQHRSASQSPILVNDCPCWTFQNIFELSRRFRKVTIDRVYGVRSQKWVGPEAKPRKRLLLYYSIRFKKLLIKKDFDIISNPKNTNYILDKSMNTILSPKRYLISYM